MKVFGCKVQRSYGGGIILVAANSVEEAFNVASLNEKLDYLFDSRDKDGLWCDRNSPDAIIESDCYPIQEWHEYEHLSCDYKEPQVILEESYYE